MKKEEFIKKLKEKLFILDEKEIDDIIEEYTGYIEEKMQKGATEEEAIKDFGSIDELTTELLQAYKINVKHNNYEKNWILKVTDTISSWMDQLVKFFSNKTGSEIIKIIFEILIILVLISLCKIPFYFLEELGQDVFLITKSKIGLGLFRIWKTIIELAYIIFAVVLFVKIFEKRYLQNDEEIIEKQEKKNDSSKSSTKERTKKTQKNSPQEEKKEQIIVETPKRKGFIDLLSTACLYFVKFIVFWINFGIAAFILGMGICVGICLYLMVKGVFYFGIYCSIIILLILGVIAFIALFNFLCNRKNNVPMMLISFVTCFVFLGISFSFASVEVATTEFINEVPSEFKESHITEAISMDENYIFMEKVEYIEDETLTNKILIDFSYFADFYSLNPKIEFENNRVYFIRNFEGQQWNKKIFDIIIEDLKDRRVYNYSLYPTVKVYTSRENIKILEQNRQEWIRRNRLYYMYDCEEEYQKDGYEDLSEFCKKFINENI